MKKIFAILLVLALGIPAMADVAITATDAGSQQLQISFAGPANAVRGIALTVTVTNGTIESGAFISSDFNTFIDYAFTTGAGYTIGSGHPLALETAAGVATFPIASGDPFAVSVGYLDEGGTKLGLTSGSVALIQISNIPNNDSATVTIAANATRGGAAVGDTLGDVTVQPQVMVAGPVVVTDKTLAMSAGANGSVIDNSGTYPVDTVVELHATANAGFKFANWSGDVGLVLDVNAKDTTITMSADATIVANFIPMTCRDRIAAYEPTKLADYDAYAAVGNEPLSWCWKFQCRGDANHDTQVAGWRVYTNDVAKISANWKKTIAQGAQPQADVNHDGQVAGWRAYTNDISVVSTNWKKTDAALTACPANME